MATTRSVYLALSRQSKAQHAHFGIFIPNVDCERTTISQDYRSMSCTGTVIHVVGEPLMAGYALEFKRNFECSTEPDLEKAGPTWVCQHVQYI
ncbi:hypothetical protein VFPPC_15554 [Pochonia chlamydosporia 170]|uniref:Uncharacterized protein n=1 Tax=Pochonia chlamydosporia 170 TaxID=1380566 RepID=A0A179FYU0_METCM|nr:hypothetical protein VFPPC_15554 [Pochonia chlamydosporia 170]OAQ70223.1 hypothetical protein VFPPC_15554 [Pochonia chlamydosporia 170]